MKRNLKALGLSLFVLFALNAIAASTAFAIVDTFTSETKTTVVTGSSTTPIEFSIPKTNTKIKCWTNTFSGTLSKPEAGEMTLRPTHFGTEKEASSKNCEIGGAPVEARINGCDYKFSGSTTGEEEGKVVAPLQIECPEGKRIELVLSFGCIFKIPAQVPTAGGLTYENGIANEKGDISTKLQVTGITYESPAVACFGLSGVKEGDNMVITGSVTISGYKDECGEGECPFVPKGGQEADAYTDGAQVGIEVI
jgi:hypothetical protein